jgi:selenide,water dikinase
LGPEALAHVLRPFSQLFPADAYPDLKIGLGQPDDAAVYQLTPQQALIFTVDFFTPVVDEARDYGAIAAANALSDVYAMGGQPLLALNLLAIPETLDPEIVADIVLGGAEKVREAGAVVAGGHTISDPEPKFGLAVVGLGHPDQIFTKGGARPGDALILTKPLGTGTLSTALKNERAEPAEVAALTASMLRLNRAAAEAARVADAHAVTDITGYGLLGHGLEMARAGGVTFAFRHSALPWLPGAQRTAAAGIFPGGTSRNADFFGGNVHFDPALDDTQRWLMFDPQTSGGLLLAVDPEHVADCLQMLHEAGETAVIVGEVRPLGGQSIVVER